MSVEAISVRVVGAVLWSMLFSVPAVLAAQVSEPTPAVAALQPSPELEPKDVTRIQLEALQSNTSENEGIALTYRFASPDNRKVTGPLPRFVAMVRSPPYDRLLNHTNVEFGPVVVIDGKAHQPIMIVDSDGERTGYLWVLSRQLEGEFEDCWMTDAVIATDEVVPQQMASHGT